jgi:hypothetical protein
MEGSDKEAGIASGTNAPDVNALPAGAKVTSSAREALSAATAAAHKTGIATRQRLIIGSYLCEAV